MFIKHTECAFSFSCACGLFQKLPHKSVVMLQKVPHKSVKCFVRLLIITTFAVDINILCHLIYITLSSSLLLDDRSK